MTNMDETNKDETEEKESLAVCPECAAGVMHLRSVTYFTWLNALLNPAAGRKPRPSQRRKPRPLRGDRPQP